MSNLPNADDTPDFAAEEQLRAVYLRVERCDAPQTELQTAACEFVAHLRMVSLPPEQVLIRVKRVVGDPLGSSRDPEAPEARSTLNEQLIRWCIEAYYRPQSQ